MASLHTDSIYQDFSPNALTLPDFLTPPFHFSYPMITTPLMLPRDWPDNCFSPSAGALCDTFDFQSNHLESAQLDSGLTSPVPGLGIRNVDLPEAAEAKDHGIFELSGVFIQDIDNCNLHNSVSNALGHRTNISDNIISMAGSTAPLGSSWSFSSILRAAELADDQTSTGLQSSFSCKTSLGESASQLSGNSDVEVAFSLERLSAATGLSLAEIAAEISATAEATLKKISDNNIGQDASCLSSDYQWLEGFDSRSHTLTWPNKSQNSISSLRDDGQFDDASWNSMGVNPSDILPVSVSPTLSNNLHGNIFLIHPDDILRPPSEHLTEKTVIGSPVRSKAENTGLALDQISDEALKPGSPYQAPSNLPLEREHQDFCMVSDDDVSVFESPSSSEYSPALQSLGGKRPRFSKTISRVTRGSGKENPPGSPKESALQSLPPIDLGTPVFDAHRGIDIEELKTKAERYRLRNQGRDYDKRWLISFAGKLSARGELVDEFRCYVAGCKQSNKRRDHILIHVGAHLDQRPFKCMHCSSRFLRKNECKRHELSHTGIRPFSCHLCPSPATTFVRQDLLKRHMKRTHRTDTKGDKENVELRRPRKRARY